MKCPHCQSDMKSLVLETRKFQGSVYRKRCCPGCSRFVVTVETVATEQKLPREQRQAKEKETTARELKITSLDALRAWNK